MVSALLLPVSLSVGCCQKTMRRAIMIAAKTHCLEQIDSNIGGFITDL